MRTTRKGTSLLLLTCLGAIEVGGIADVSRMADASRVAEASRVADASWTPAI